MRPRRRRGLLLLSLALASGGLAASQVRERERGVDARVGPLVPVVVAAHDIPPDEPLRARDMAVEQVPARFVPPDALGAPARLAGARTAVPVLAGAYITTGVLRGAEAAGDGPLKPGERAVELAVAGGAALALAGPGSRVDVLVSTRRHDGAGRTFVALEDVALLDLRPAAGGDFPVEETVDQPEATALATLRVTARQAVYLTAAQSFAHEIRLLIRPPGDRRRTGPIEFGEGVL
ncbi:MAG: Flp pilus assembly protein CpaB [Thermoleophilaceae bacterium]